MLRKVGIATLMAMGVFLLIVGVLGFVTTIYVVAELFAPTEVTEVPPTPISPTVTPTEVPPTPTPVPPTPTPTPVPCSLSAFGPLGVRTIVENVAPGEAVEIRVSFENNGSCPWPSGTTIAFSGAVVTFESSVLGEIQPDRLTEYRVTITAPEREGKYTFYLSIVTPNGEIISGSDFLIVLYVEPSPTPTEPTATPVPPTPIPLVEGAGEGFWDEEIEGLDRQVLMRVFLVIGFFTFLMLGGAGMCFLGVFLLRRKPKEVIEEIEELEAPLEEVVQICKCGAPRSSVHPKRCTKGHLLPKEK